MAKFRCRCGSVIRTSGGIPNPQQWLLTSDVAFDRFNGLVESEDVYRSMIHAYRCDDCQRMWIYWDGYEKDPTEYEPK